MIIVVTGAASGCKAMDGGGRVEPNIVFPSLPRTCRTLQRTWKPKVETIHVLLLLLLIIYTARASASLTFLKFFDQTREPIDKAGDISRILLSTKTLHLQATNFASLDGKIAENLTQFTICSSIYVGFFRKNFFFLNISEYM